MGGLREALAGRLAPLRARLTLTVLAVAAVGLVLLAAVTYAEQRSFLYERVDDQVRAAVVPVGAALAGRDGPGMFGGPGPGERGRGPGFGLPPGTYGEYRDAGGEVADAVVIGFDRTRTPDPAIPDTLPLGELVTVDGEGGDDSRYRVLARQAPGGGALVVAVPLRETDQTLDRLLFVEALVIGLVLAGLALVSWLVVRAGLRPLDRIAATADGIAGGDLSHRVEDPDPRTEAGRLGIALNRMLDRLEAAFAEREASEDKLRRFLADASHELRTPLTSIRGYAELFSMGATAEPAETERAMRRIEEEAARMGVLVEDLLTLARLDEVASAPHVPVDLEPLVRDAAADARASAPDRDVRVGVEGDVMVRGDDAQLRQVVANLVRNALVHTPAGTPVELGLARAGDRVRLSVRDHGPGLPVADGEALFERFWRAEAGRGRGAGGAGLGLAIVAAVVDAHDGSVAAADAHGGGAVFTVELPAEGRRAAGSSNEL